MASNQSSNAYDFSRFENRGNAAPQRQTPEAAPQRKHRNNVLRMPEDHVAKVTKTRRRHKNRGAVAWGIAAVVISIIAAFLIFGQVRLAELTKQIEDASNQLVEAQSLYTQYQMKADSQYSLAAVEKYAEKMGMIKAEQSQMNYVSLSAADKGQVVQEDSQNWLGSAWGYVVQMLS